LEDVGVSAGPDYTDVDRAFYEAHLAGFLPAKLLDAHVHVFRQQDAPFPDEETMRTNWAASVSAEEFTVEDVEAEYRKLFPRSEVSRLQFGQVRRDCDIEAMNRYCAESADGERVWAHAVLDPLWSPEKLHEVLTGGRFAGVKPYWSLVPGKAEKDVPLEEMLPPQHIEVLDELGLAVTLHVPGPERIRDLQTRRLLREWPSRYPNVTFIIAHLGRAYCIPFAEGVFEELADVGGLLFDCSANLNADVFERAFRVIGPRRILWGTDFPVLNRLRGYRVHEGETYHNVVSGDYPWNRDRRPAEVEAGYTYLIYESLRTMRQGAQRAGLTSADLQDIFYWNAYRVLTGRGTHAP
jgi:predicted TIM-barrel fold metal-dependent hydrolase